ncbi:MAG: Maf family protein, partial [Candidatus Omnitrophota bacterium]|nr:Maf family protein [Candidatus Omnitrophota bacterium]
IGADTVVLLNKKVVGKPKSASHAKSMLRKMSGKAISVYTGLSVVDARTQKRAIGYKKSIVRVRKINSREISRIFSLLGPYDKAGGFSIEGAGSFIFDNIKGSYFNVLGLPTALLRDLFSRLGFDLLRCVKKI